MQTARSNAVIMPNSEPGPHASRKLAQEGQMRPENAMPVFNGTTRPYRMIPGHQQISGDCSRSRINALQQMEAGWSKHRSTQPCPPQQSNRWGVQCAASLFLPSIKQTSKQQSLRQSQADMLRELLDLPLCLRTRQWHQFIQQFQQSFDLLLSLLGRQQSIRPDHHNFQQALQLLPEIARAIGHIAEASQLCFPFHSGRFSGPSPATGSFGTALFLPLDRRQTGLFRLYGTVKMSLDARSELEEMPDIALVVRFALRLRKCLSNRESTIAHGARTRDALFLQIPQQEGPTVAINGHRRNRCPDLPTMHINHIQIRFPSLTTVLFVQGQRSWRRGLLLVQPFLRLFPCLFNDASYTSQAQIDPVHVFQAGLNFSITGMRFNQQHQNQNRKWSWLLRQQRASQRCFQRLGTRGCPTIHRLTRDTVHTTQLCDQSMFGFRQHLADHVNALLNSATMDHDSSLKMVKVFLSLSPYLSGILFVNFQANCHIGSSSL